MTYTSVCQRCGKEFESPATIAELCPDCLNSNTSGTRDTSVLEELKKEYAFSVRVGSPYATVYSRLIKRVLILFNQYEEENNKLRYQVNRLKKYDEERDILLHEKLINKAKIEAYKDIKKKILEKSEIIAGGDYGFTYEIEEDDLDNILYELIGGDKNESV